MQTLEIIKRKAAVYLRQGISPRRLALTLVLGFVVGCIPVVGLPTALCAMLALAFRLNLPAIQAANYVAMPFQVALIVPLLRLGSKLFPVAPHHGANLSAVAHSPAQILAQAPQLAVQIGGMAGQALFAWLLLAIPVVGLLTPAVAAVLRRVPALTVRPGNVGTPVGHPNDEDLSLGSPVAVESGD
jgi:Uncharacterized protein conserved in bacteria (DUF2062)